MTFRNWSGSVAFAPARFERPASLEELVHVVRSSPRPIRVVGSGHSFTDLVKTTGTLVSLDRLAGIVEVDGNEVTVWGGTTLRRLGRLLAARGLALENLGDIDAQSIAGAASTGTHGTGVGLPILAGQLSGMTLVTAAGDVLELSQAKDTDVFRAAQVSLGALGVIARVRVRARPAYRLQYRMRRESLDGVLRDLDRAIRENRHFELFWFPHTETAQTKTLNETDAPPRSSPLSRFVNDIVLENGAFFALSEACRFKPSLSPGASRLAARFVSQREGADRSHRVFATPRLVRFNEMEYALPLRALEPALRDLKRFIEKDRVSVHFPVEVRFARGDDIDLSPCHGRETALIAVHVYRGMDFRSYFNGAESLFRRYEGRPHWGKLHSLGASELGALYPRWDRFQETRRRLDPEGVFLNDHLARLFGVS